MELWDIYNKDRVKTGRTMIRGSKFNSGDYHMVVHVCIFNSKGEMLMQQRQPFKEGWPNMWDVTAGGSALAGETSATAAERELLEEIGCKIDFLDKRPCLTVNTSYGFNDYYLIENDVDTESLSLQYEEVQRVKWADKAEILRLIDSGEFVAYYYSLMETLFDMRNATGCLRV